MIQTRNISERFEFFEKDLPAVKALWDQLHAQAMEQNCWPSVPSDKMLAHIVKTHDWAVVEDGDLGLGTGDLREKQSLHPSSQSPILGFSFWKIDPDGNAFVRAIAAQTEAPYLHLVVASVLASQTHAYGMLQRSRPEYQWFKNIRATFEPCGYEPLDKSTLKQIRKTVKQESGKKSRVLKAAQHTALLAARTPIQDKVIVPVSLLPAIQARLEVF